MAFFIDIMNRWQPKNASANSFHSLILDAHEWGEMRVRAELLALEMREATAVTRHTRMRSLAQAWYSAGYRMYLLPEGTDVPNALREKAFRTNAKLIALSANLRHTMAHEAGGVWWKKHSSVIFNEASAAVAAEVAAVVLRCSATAAHVTQASSSTSCSPTTPATAPLSTPAKTVSHSLAQPKHPKLPKLPKLLLRLLESPSQKHPNAPRASIEAAVAASFDAQRAMRVWDDSDSKEEGRTFKLLPTRAETTQASLKARGLSTVYGHCEQAKGDAALQNLGMRRLAGGGYNTVWVASKHDVPCMKELFPDRSVAERFLEGKLVLRVPHERAPWVSFDEAVGEATNMLLSALCGFGPKVALLSYARKSVDNPDSNEEGVKVCRYKIFAFLERATESVERRYSLEVMPCASATASLTYYNALLVCVYRYSSQGFVHLDGTLRNLVDFYPDNLPTDMNAWRINVIDVEKKHFRRLCPMASTDWRDLFLMNLLVTLTFLKIHLGSRWNPSLHWRKDVSATVSHLISDMHDRRTLPAIVHWQGAFTPDETVPDMSHGPYVGDTHNAAARCLTHQLRYYLLKQPLEQCAGRYVDKFLSGQATPKVVEAGRVWYDGCYRPNLYPAHCFFREHLEVGPSRQNSRLLVTLLSNFLETPHGALQATYSNRLPPLTEHRRGIAPEVLLGV